MKTGKKQRNIINAANEVEYYYFIEYGEAAFYGPVGFHGKDALGRQCN
jgi:threonyl-tRNA synthetase